MIQVNCHLNTCKRHAMSTSQWCFIRSFWSAHNGCVAACVLVRKLSIALAPVEKNHHSAWDWVAKMKDNDGYFSCPSLQNHLRTRPQCTTLGHHIFLSDIVNILRCCICHQDYLQLKPIVNQLLWHLISSVLVAFRCFMLLLGDCSLRKMCVVRRAEDKMGV